MKKYDFGLMDDGEKFKFRCFKNYQVKTTGEYRRHLHCRGDRQVTGLSEKADPYDFYERLYWLQKKK